MPAVSATVRVFISSIHRDARPGRTGSLIRLTVMGTAIGLLFWDTAPKATAAPPEYSPAVDAERTGPTGNTKDAKMKLTNTSRDRLQHFQAIMDRYYRGETIQQAEDALNRSIEQYNRSAEASHARSESTRKELEKEFARIEPLGRQIEDMDKQLAAKPDRHDQAAVKAYNDLVTRRNDAVTRYNTLGKPLKERQQTHNELIKRSP
jgi:hypothetical protein